MLELADSLDPVVIRREVEERFSPENMVANYVAAYEATIEATAAREAPLSVRPRDLPARAPRAGRARGGAALPARRHGDRRPSRPARSSPRSGIAFTILGGIFAIFNFLQYGTTAQVARAGGAGESETARRLGAQAVWLSLAFGIAVSALIARARGAARRAHGRRGRGRRLRGRPTCGSRRSASRRRSSRSAGRATCAGSPTCGRRS